LLRAGLNFEANGELEQANRNYREPLKLLMSEDQENFKTLHYRVGRVAGALGNNEAAEEHHNKVAASG
jgi:hypothetical protein